MAAVDKGDYKAAYEYLSPSSKAFKSLAAFEAGERINVEREVKPTRAECDKDGRCSVTRRQSRTLATEGRDIWVYRFDTGSMVNSSFR